MARVMILSGGWPDHRPGELAELFAGWLSGEHQVGYADDLGALRPEGLSGVDLLILIWTYGDLDAEQERGLQEAVEGGMGLLAWHGAASAFLASRVYKHLLGGQFVGHPGGDAVAYTVKFLDGDPLAEGLGEIKMVSEQYYLLVDPAVKPIATTRMRADAQPWLTGVEMPVAWKRQWGGGRVFYCALGHRRADIDVPAIRELFRRAVRWAAPGP